MVTSTKEQLINNIREAFKNVFLGNGIGLWEAQGLDDRLSESECKKLRRKDEKLDWNKIPIIDLYKCASSLSFFDAEGMRFHLPMLLLVDLDVFKKEEENFENLNLSPPEIAYHLTQTENVLLNERFSLLNKPQIECVIQFILFKMNEIKLEYINVIAKQYNSSKNAFTLDNDYIQLENGLTYWKNKLNEL